MTVIGIDPGKNGAIAWQSINGICVEKMPDTIKDLWDLITSISNDSNGNLEVTHCYIESISSSPQMGVVSAFTFGRGYGNLEMALIAANISFTRVRPQVWMKSLNCLTKGSKNVTKRYAQELFPRIKCTHAVSDALLISEYGRRLQNMCNLQ